MKQDYQHTFLEFLIAENKELKAFIKSVVEKSLKIDKPVISGGPMPSISDFYDKDKNVMHPSYGGTINLNNLGEVRTKADAGHPWSPNITPEVTQAFRQHYGLGEYGVGAQKPVSKSAIDIAKERIEKIPAETPEEKAEKEQALKEMNNIFGLD